MNATLLKKRLWHRCFAVNFLEIFKYTFLSRAPPVAATENTESYQLFRHSEKLLLAPIRALPTWIPTRLSGANHLGTALISLDQLMKPSVLLEISVDLHSSKYNCINTITK